MREWEEEQWKLTMEIIVFGTEDGIGTEDDVVITSDTVTGEA